MVECPWASYIGEPVAKDDENLIALPENEQVSRGQELMDLLQVASVPTPRKYHSQKLPGLGWDVVVKHSFIEVLIPECRRPMKRSLSDSALPLFEKPEYQWKHIVSEKLQASEDKDMSDASTNISVEAEDHDRNFASSSTREDVCWSSDDEKETETQLSSEAMPFSPGQYTDAWWMHMGFPASPQGMCGQAFTGYDQASACFDQSVAAFDQTHMSYASSSYATMQWGEQTMGNVECHGVDADGNTREWRTTVMIRNMPNNYTRQMLLELVDSMGFAGTYDFAYLPVDFQSQAGLGYAFIDFATVADAQLCFERFEGFSDWRVPSEKVCTVTWSSPTQGLEAHIERYKNSPVMHPSLPDEWKPVLIQNGVRVQFPPPTKPIKTPKVRQHPSTKGGLLA
jgi:hypothetical protein